MAIKRICNDKDNYEVGKDDVKSIELTSHGGEDAPVYKVTYADDSLLFVGFFEHEIEWGDTKKQMTIFDYLQEA